MLSPLPTGSALDRMRAAGEIDAATEDPRDLPEPVTLGASVELPSVTLHRLRHDER